MCYRPKFIINKSTNMRMAIPCRECESCVNSKSYNNSVAIKLESSLNKYTFFVTLTYSDDFVPVAHLSIKEVPVNEFGQNYELRLENKCSRLTDYFSEQYESQIIFLSYVKESEITKIKNAIRLTAYNCKHRESNGIYQIPFICSRELQLFIKRLRFHLYKRLPINGQNSLRYYCATEYGPRTLRPHAHLCLFTNSDSVAQLLTELVSKAWPFGRVDTQLSKGGCADYVSKYTTSSVFVPLYLKGRKVRPTQIHSSHLGQIKNQAIEQSCKSLKYERISKFQYRSDSHVTDYYPSAQIEAGLFPKCYRYEHATSRMRLVRYLIRPYSEHIFGKINPHTLKPFTTNDYIYRLLSYGSDIEQYNPHYTSVVDSLLSDIHFSDSKESCLQSMFNTSSIFVKNCRDLGLSYKQYLQDIEQYYIDKEKDTLKKWYIQRESDSLTSPDYQHHFDFDNLLYPIDGCLKPFSLAKNSLYYLSEDSDTSVSRICHELSLPHKYDKKLLDKQTNSINQFNKNIKHKVLNDILKRLIN